MRVQQLVRQLALAMVLSAATALVSTSTVQAQDKTPVPPAPAPATPAPAPAPVAPAVTPAPAATPEKPAGEKPPAKKKSDLIPFHGKLKAVDKVASTITLPGKEKDHVYTITSKTKITKAGKPAILDDATVGEDVGGVAKKGAKGEIDVISLRIGAKVEAAPKTKDDAAPKTDKKAAN